MASFPISHEGLA